jgi:hypothetical protein
MRRIEERTPKLYRQHCRELKLAVSSSLSAGAVFNRHRALRVQQRLLSYECSYSESILGCPDVAMPSWSPAGAVRAVLEPLA